MIDWFYELYFYDIFQKIRSGVVSLISNVPNNYFLSDSKSEYK